MSEDVKPAPEGDVQPPDAPAAKATEQPQEESAWVKEASDEEKEEALKKLQTKSRERWETIQTQQNQLDTLQAELDALKAEKHAAQQAELEQQGEWQTLAQQAQAEVDALKQQMADQVTASKRKDLELTVIAKAAFLGFTDPADAINLMDISNIANTEEAVTDALKALAENKPYLLKSKEASSGDVPPPQQRKMSPMNSGSGGKESDMQDWHPLLNKRDTVFGDGSK